MSVEAGILEQVGASDDPAKFGPIAVRLEEDQLMCRPSFVRYTPTRGFTRGPRPAGRLGVVSTQRRQEIRRQGPYRRREQGDVDDRTGTRCATA